MPRSRVGLWSWVVAIAFLVGTALTYADRLNLFATPPNLPESLNMVDRTIGNADYRQAIWPVFLWTNLAFAIGFAASVAFAWVVAARSRVGDGLAVFVALATVGGTISALASVMYIGSVDSAVWQLYCDCGFKQTEIIAGIWAGDVAQSIADWLSRFAGVILAVGLVALARDARDVLTPLLRSWTYLTAIVIAVSALLAAIGGQIPIPGELVDLLQTLIGAVLVPVWAVWLGRRIEATGSGPQPATV